MGWYVSQKPFLVRTQPSPSGRGTAFEHLQVEQCPGGPERGMELRGATTRPQSRRYVLRPTQLCRDPAQRMRENPLPRPARLLKLTDQPLRVRFITWSAVGCQIEIELNPGQREPEGDVPTSAHW